jgi:hypothetical protein
LADSSSLPDRYASSPIIRGLVQLIPAGLGSAFDTAFVTAYSRLQEKRLRAFFDALAQGGRTIDPALIESESFLHCYFSTVRAVLKSRREQKIRLFAALLGAVSDGAVTDVDAYEEYLSILDELSYRELVLLSLLDLFERESHGPPGIDDAGFAQSFWSAFSNEAMATLSLQEGELDAMLNRHNRSGCFTTFLVPTVGRQGAALLPSGSTSGALRGYL